MIQLWKNTQWTRALALVLITGLVSPLVAGCGSKGDNAAPASSPSANMPSGPTAAMAPVKKPGLTKGQKTVIVLAGAALLYYLYKKHQAQQQAAGAANANGRPQLYRSKNGGIYYRNAQHQAIWVTAPAQQVSVPADQVQQYAPDYQQYQGQPAPPAPPGYRTQPFSQLDPESAQN